MTVGALLADLVLNQLFICFPILHPLPAHSVSLSSLNLDVLTKQASHGTHSAAPSSAPLRTPSHPVPHPPPQDPRLG